MILVVQAPFAMDTHKQTVGARLIEQPEFLTPDTQTYRGNITRIKSDFWMDDREEIELMMTKETKNWDIVFPYGGEGDTKARVGPNDISYIKKRF